MSLPPDILFHRFFQEGLTGTDRKRYKGKYALTGKTQFEQLLAGLQIVLNEALEVADKTVPHHVHYGPFYVDYIDSDVENALAFQNEGYSFIGLTEPLMYKLLQISDAISQLGAIELNAALPHPIDHGDLRTVIFRASLFFIASHEYTHHVHGHLAIRKASPAFYDEVETRCITGSLEDQVLEIDADGYAAFLVLNNLISNKERLHAVSVLGRDQQPSRVQDEILFFCFVMAVGGFFFTSKPHVIDSSNVYLCDHPPHAARMDLLMKSALRWCAENNRALAAWMTVERFNLIMRIIVQATWGMNRGQSWVEQNAFFGSEDGAEYFRRVGELMNRHLESLGARR
jgi:hypothetical protein